MKDTHTIKGLIGCAIALVLISSASAQNMAPTKAQVVRMAGRARFTTGNNVWQPVKVGDVYGAGTVIQTDTSDKSYVDLVLGDGKGSVSSEYATGPQAAPITASMASYQPQSEQNVVRVWGNTALGIENLATSHTGADVVSDTQLDLKQGHIFGTVKKMTAGSRYEIKLPNGVAGIRGTSYDLWSDGRFRIGSGSGAISLMGTDNQPNTKVVPGGFEYNPTTDQLSALPANVLNSMLRLEQDVRVIGAPQTVYFTSDHTIHHVSPTHGHHGHGNGNGDDNNQGDEGQTSSTKTAANH